MLGNLNKNLYELGCEGKAGFKRKKKEREREMVFQARGQHKQRHEAKIYMMMCSELA